MQHYPSVKDAARNLSSSASGRRNPDDAFMICDLSDAAILLKQWVKFMPRIRPYYAMRAAPYPPLVKFLQLQGCGINCASQKEIDTALDVGAKREDIIYSAPDKPITHLLYAKDKDITLTVYDCEGELRKIYTHFPKARLLLRLQARPGIDGAMSERFSANLSQAMALIRISKELGLNTVGISIIPGSSCLDDSRFDQVIKEARGLFDFAATLGMKFEILNIREEFEGSSCSTDRFYKLTMSMNRALDDQFPEEIFPRLNIMSQTGTYFCDRTFTLISNVIAKKENANGIDYTMNNGLYGSYMRTLLAGNDYDTFEAFPLFDKESGNPERPCRLYGPTCDGFDVIKKKAFLPNLEIGDWLMWPECGAHTFAMNTSFNGMGTEVFYNITTEQNRLKLDQACLRNLDSICRDGTTICAKHNRSFTLSDHQMISP